jgi:hypothetical protein
MNCEKCGCTRFISVEWLWMRWLTCQQCKHRFRYDGELPPLKSERQIWPAPLHDITPT